MEGIKEGPSGISSKWTVGVETARVRLENEAARVNPKGGKAPSEGD